MTEFESQLLSEQLKTNELLAGVKAALEAILAERDTAKKDTAATDNQCLAPETQQPAGKIPRLNGIETLISEGHLAPDGRTVLTSLQTVTQYLSTKKVAVTKMLLKTYFVKKDGEQYSDRALTKAVNIANAK